MGRKPKVDHPLGQEIAAIRTLLENLLIIQAANAGITKDEVRRIVGVDANRVTSLWKHLKLPHQQKG